MKMKKEWQKRNLIECVCQRGREREWNGISHMDHIACTVMHAPCYMILIKLKRAGEKLIN
jgi:hypothetical protein